MRVNLLRLVGVDRRQCGWSREDGRDGEDVVADPPRNVIWLVRNRKFRGYWGICSMVRKMGQIGRPTGDPPPATPGEATFREGRRPMNQLERRRLRRLLTRALE